MADHAISTATRTVGVAERLRLQGARLVRRRQQHHLSRQGSRLQLVQGLYQ